MRAAQRPITFIGINERTPEMWILYMTSSALQALHYDPEEFIGYSAREFLFDNADGEELKKGHGSHTDDNVLITCLFLKDKNGAPRYTRSITFTCSNVGFHLGTIYPDIDFEQHRRRLAIQKFKCNLSENATDQEKQTLENILHRHKNHFSACNTHDDSDKGRERGRSMHMNTPYSMRTTPQACFVLKDTGIASREQVSDLKIIFVTDSINRILDVDSSDLQGVSFLSMVDVEDSTKAAAFLEKVLQSNELVLERLQFLANPLEGILLGEPKSVTIEFMGMGSDEGAILLCQLEQSSVFQLDDCSRYLPFEEIISSDPETSDMPEEWSIIDPP
ncbi:hypothetical protein GGI12_001419 [Dipsacomyces acuminosporus]|nr:hypothetical protein GGI12_001419 [Dipsacomyces acuminosporus]